MSNLLGNQVWSNIATHLEGSVRTLAAIAYVGKVGPELVPLAAGDAIVVDASDQSLKNGTVHPEAIRSWLAAGVHVYSLSGLHAKIIVAEKPEHSVVIVGSANASEASRTWRAEACLTSTDRETIDDATGLIRGWIAVADAQLDAAWVTRAQRIYRTPPTQPRRQKKTVVLDGDRLWIGVRENTQTASGPTVQKAVSQVQDEYSNVVVQPWLMEQHDANLMRTGDTIVLSNAQPGKDPAGNSQSGPPAKVVQIVDAVDGHDAAAVYAFDADWSTTTHATVRTAAGETPWTWDDPIEDQGTIRAILAAFGL